MSNNEPDYKDNLYFEEKKMNDIKYTPEDINHIFEENIQLKELLKECFEYIDWTDGTSSPINQQELLDKIDEILK